MTHRAILPAFLIVAATLPPSPCLAQWSATGNVVAEAPESEFLDNLSIPPLGAMVCSDGQGGLIAAWRVNKPGSEEVRINRLDPSTGASLWGTPDGVLANTGFADFWLPQVESDRAGGAWVVWSDDRAGTDGIYAQRFDAAGAPLLTAGGVRIGTSSLPHFDIATTASGKLLLAIGYPSNAPLTGVYVQRVSLAGALEFTASGKQMSTDAATPVLQVFGNGEGGLVSWASNDAGLPGPSGFSRIKANRFDNFGNALWGAGGAVVLAGADAYALDHRAAWDGASLFVTWMDIGADSTVKAQQLNTSGVAQWSTTATGQSVVDFTASVFATTFGSNPYHVRPQIVADGLGGCVIAWIDARDETRAGPGPGLGAHFLDVYAQRLDATGARLWAPQGAAVDSLSGEASNPQICSDGDHGAYLAYRHHENLGFGFYEENVRVTRLAFDGSVAWTLRPHMTAPVLDGQQPRISIAPDALGGVVMVWQDGRNSGATGSDLYGGARTARALLPCELLAAEPSIPGPDAPNSVITGDWNEDGILDLATTLVSGAVNTFFGTGVAGVGDGGFAGGNSYAVTSTQSLASGDLNADGILDLAATSSTLGIVVLLGQGGGGVGNGTFASPGTAYAAGTGPRGIAVADFNDDGILDLVCANLSSDNVTVRLGNGSGGVGDGTFGAATNFAAGDAPLRLLIEDFNEDGRWDLAVTNSSGAGTVSVLLGGGSGSTGDGSFGAPVAYTTGNTPTLMESGDFDEDGITDLAVGYLSGLAVLRGSGGGGNGDGGFLAPQTYAIGSGAGRGIAVADVNDDGRADLVVAEPAQDRLQLLLGDGIGEVGDGTFTKVLTLPVGDLPNAIVAGDFVEDGVPDFLTANQNGDSFSLRSGACAVLGDVGIGISSPTSGEAWAVGEKWAVTWSQGSAIPAVDVEISRDGGANWQPIARRRTVSEFSWNVTPPPTSDARIRVRDSNVPGRFAVSARFTITDTPVAVSRFEPGTRVSAAWPTPSRGAVHLSVSLASAGDVSVEVLDVRGRLVETLHRGRIEAGAHTFVWREGPRVTAGLYFLRARWDGGEAVRRVVRLD